MIAGESGQETALGQKGEEEGQKGGKEGAAARLSGKEYKLFFLKIYKKIPTARTWTQNDIVLQSMFRLRL